MASKPAGVEITVRGDKELRRALAELPRQVRNKVVRQAVRRGMKEIQKGVQERMPVSTGIAKSSLVVRVAKARKRGTILLEVRYDTEKLRRSFTESFYPAAIEYGLKKKDRPPAAPMRRAYDEDGPGVQASVTREIVGGIEREADALRSGPTL